MMAYDCVQVADVAFEQSDFYHATLISIWCAKYVLSVPTTCLVILRGKTRRKSYGMA